VNMPSALTATANDPNADPAVGAQDGVGKDVVNR
jgi:hypothetical protein